MSTKMTRASRKVIDRSTKATTDATSLRTAPTCRRCKLAPVARCLMFLARGHTSAQDFGNAKEARVTGHGEDGRTPVMEFNAEMSKIQESRPGSKPKLARPADFSLQKGLTSDEARRRLEKFGPQRDARYVASFRCVWRSKNSGRRFRGCSRLRSCSNWRSANMSRPRSSPFSWYSMLPSDRSRKSCQATLAALKSRLALNASVRRDDAWKTIPAGELVPDDVVKLSLGAVVAAVKEARVIFQRIQTYMLNSIIKRSLRCFS